MPDRFGMVRTAFCRVRRNPSLPPMENFIDAFYVPQETGSRSSVLTAGLTGVVMPARSGAFPAHHRWPMVWPTCHRLPRMLVRRGGLMLASRLTPDAARVLVSKEGRGHTGGAEPARNACGNTSNIWTASEPLCGPLAVHKLAGPTIQRSRSSHARAMATSADDGAAGTGARGRILASHDHIVQGCVSAALARVQAAAGSQRQRR
jgi:hypothetical protein